MSKKIVITEKSNNAARILNYLSGKKLELKNKLDAKAEKIIVATSQN